MTVKVTAKVVIVVIILTSCNAAEENVDDVGYQQQLDSIAGRSIDSAYRSIQKECNQKRISLLPHLVDSVLKDDSLRHVY